MNVPVPSIDPPPGPIEIEARREHAALLRAQRPGITDREILRDWASDTDAARRWLLDAARRRIEARAAEPVGPDESDLLRARLDTLRSGDRLDVVTSDGDRREFVVTGDPQVREDGTVSFDAADAERHAAMERLLRNGGAIIDRAMRAGRFTDQPHHARGWERTDEEHAALEPYKGEGCCRAAYDSDGFAHDHEGPR